MGASSFGVAKPKLQLAAYATFKLSALQANSLGRQPDNKELVLAWPVDGTPINRGTTVFSADAGHKQGCAKFAYKY